MLLNRALKILIMKKILLFLFLVQTFFGFSQNTYLEGKVTDEKGLPLEMANVVAIVTSTGKMATFGVTNDKGLYQISLTENTEYTLKVSYMGFNTEVMGFVTQFGNQKVSKNFKLTEKSSALGEVELKYTMPVTVKGDTIVYNADSFTTGNEKKLEDVLEKLPGVEINDDGQVEVEGTQVSKIMVNGKDFFDGDSKLATKNIPANAVDKVEVLKNYSEVSQLKGLENDQDAIALNIKLKEGKENFWFGEITAGGGADEKYLAHPKVFYYSPKKSLNILTDFNNIGEAPFTMQDYFKFSGGFKNLMKKGGSSMRINTDQLGISLMNNDKALSVVSRFGALNFNYSFTDHLDFSGFAIYNDSDTDMNTETYKNFFPTETIENQSKLSNQRNQLGMLKLSSKYKPSSTLEWNYDVIFKKSKQTEQSQTISTINGMIETLQSQEPFSINQNTELFYTINDNHVISGSVQHTLDQNAPLYSATSLDEFFETSAILNMQYDVLYQLTQNKGLNSHKVDAKVDYFYVLNNTSNLNFTLGNTYSAQRLDSDLFQTLTNGNTYQFDNTILGNDANFKFNDLFLALHYNIKWGKLTVTPGLSIHQFNLNDTQFDDSNKVSTQKILPDFYAEYKFKNTRSMRLEYGITNEFSDINKYAAGLLLNSYQSLNGGSRDLESSLYHTYTLRYFDFNMYNFTNIHGSVSYKKSVNPVKSTTQILNTDIVSYPINLQNPDENISGNLNAGKKFKKWEINVGSSVNYGQNYTLLNSAETLSKSLTQNYNISFETRFKEVPNFELGYRYSISDYTGTNRDSRYLTQKPYLNVEANFLKHFTWTADFSYYDYEDADQTVSSQYSFLSSKLYYQKENSKWEFILSGDNILKTGSQDQNTASDVLISTSRYYVQPAVYMLSVKYDL